MRLFPRLLLLGAGLPATAAAVIFGVGVGMSTSALQDELDHALMSQAAVEAVSLFDGPEGLHLHMSESPFGEEFGAFAPEAAVYGTDGAAVLRYPETTSLPMTNTTWQDADRLMTSADSRFRLLTLAIENPDTGRRYGLVMAASRKDIEASQAGLTRFAVMSVLTLAAVLGVLAWVWARQLSGRVERLQRHMQHMAAGDLDLVPDADAGRDEIHDLHESIAAATTQLRANRVARERFIAEAAHELRTPLASMRVSLDLALRRVRRRTTDDGVTDAAVIDDLVTTLGEARDETERLGSLAHGLLDIASARSAPTVREPVGLEGVAAAAVAGRQKLSAERGLTVEVAVDDGIDTIVAGHAPSLRRAIDNLVDNALRYARTRVTVRLTVRPDGGISVMVDDDGDGIAAEHLDVIFEPFHRLGSDDGGIGLGLALVREVARRHGGEAFASPGPGGHVGLWLPRG